MPLIKTILIQTLASGPIGLLIAIYLPIIILLIASQWKVYTKANQPGWACLIPVVNLIFAVWVANLLSKSFGKGVGFTLGLLLLPFVFYPILGFGSSQYNGPAGN